MPRSLTNSYADALFKVLQELAAAEVAPDADLDFINTVRTMIIERLQNPQMGPEGVSVAGAQRGFSASQMAPQGGGAGAGPGGPPMQTAAAPTRLPPGMGAPGPDELAAFSNALQGTP